MVVEVRRVSDCVLPVFWFLKIVCRPDTCPDAFVVPTSGT